MKLTVLGCLGGYPYQNQGTSAYLLETDDFHLLIDVGSGSLLSLEKYLDPLQLDAVILSHYHYDHLADLGVLQYYRQLYPAQQPVPELPIYGHTDDPVHFEQLNLAGVSRAVPYFEAEELKIGPFLITFMKTIHPVPCYAMRIVEVATQQVFVYTGDSGYLASFAEFAREADLFLADTYLFAGQERHHAHFTAKEAGELAKAAQVKQLMLTHLPQHGSLALLQEQAEQAAGTTIPVSLARPGLVFDGAQSHL